MKITGSEARESVAQIADMANTTKCRDMCAATIQANMWRISWNTIFAVQTTRKSNGNSRETDK